MLRKLLFLVVSLSLCSLYGMADSRDYFRIARLSYLEGRVSFQHTDEVDWTAASINMALQPGDRIYTGDDGRAEIEFDDGSVVRLAEKTDIELLTMKEQLIQLRVLVGLCSLTGRSSVQFEVNTPAAAFTTTDKGSYRFDIAENGDSDGIVRRGQMEAANDRFSRRVESGEVLHVPAAGNAEEVLARYDQRDAWDEWNDRRNADVSAYESRKYIPDQVYVGVSDLDRYGRWAMIDGYGYGWIPQVGVSWSPYWEGRWCYRPYWGWTWVSYEPWGWLPYHYGRWYRSGSFGWCWLPGPSFGFHFWSPGLVRFYRGADWVSWCPLGPGDYYNVNNYYFNSTYVYYLNNMRLLQRRGPDDLVNRSMPGAIRSVRTDQFVNGSLGAGIGQVRGGQDPWRGGRVVTDNLDIRPTARSYAPAPDRPTVRPAANLNRAVVVRTDPEVRSRDDRFQRITNPRVVAPVARGDAARGATGSGRVEQPANANTREPARDLRSIPNTTGRKTDDMPDRGAPPARVYQVPQSRTATGNQGSSTRDVQGVPDRQQSVPRAQQPPANSRTTQDTPVRKMETAPTRTVPSTAPRVQRNETAPPVIRQETARPPAQAAPPATTRPATPPPDKKGPDKKLVSSYSPREYQAERRQAPPAQAAARQAAPAQSNLLVAPAWNASRNESYGSTRSYGSSAPRSSYNDASRSAAMRSAPQSSTMMRSAPQSAPSMRSMPSSSSMMRAAPQSAPSMRSMPSSSSMMRAAPRSAPSIRSAPQSSAARSSGSSSRRRDR